MIKNYFKAIRRLKAFTLIELLVVITIIAILASIALPVFSSVQTKGNQTKDLANAKQIGLGLRLYSSDNNGFFPNQTITSGSLTNANEAFQNIVPTYIPTQKIFYVGNSVWTPGQAAVEYSAASGTLAVNQNAYAYVANLTDTSNTNFPLMADAFSTTVGVYSPTQGQKGGVWSGKKAIVIRVDDSATVETVKQADYKVYANGANTDSSTTDIFTVGATWIPNCTVLNPQ